MKGHVVMRAAMASLMLAIGTLAVGSVSAEEWKMEMGGIQPGQMYFGARAGAGKSSQTVGTGFSNVDASTWGSVANFQGMYGINNWMAVGLMVDWDRRSIDGSVTGVGVTGGGCAQFNGNSSKCKVQVPFTNGSIGSSVDLGRQSTISLLPTVELRPVHFGPLTPYLNMGVGVNVNTTSQSGVDANNTLAFRTGLGVDYMVYNRFALNTEVAYKRNSGTLNVGGVSGDWNNSAVQFLLGGKMFF
jgi:outer membrane protein